MNRKVIYLCIILYKQVRLVTFENLRKNESVSVTANGNKRLRYLAQFDKWLGLLDTKKVQVIEH